MNYFMKCQLLSEGFKHEQLIEEDWEKLKKELTDLYVAGKITERQVSTRLTRAGMGPVAKNVAYKIAHDPENVQKREAVFSRARKEEEEKAKGEAKAAQVAKHQTRGFAAANYNSQANMDAWLKAANEYRARKEKERAAKKMSLRESFSEEVNYIMEDIYMNNEKFELIEEEVSVNKVEKRLAKMKKLLNKPRNISDSSFKDFSASEKEKMLSLIAKVEKVLARNPKTDADIEEFQEDLEDAFKEFNSYSKACKAFKGISWWFLPLGYIPPLTRLYARFLRNLSNQRPIREEANYFPY